MEAGGRDGHRRSRAGWLLVLLVFAAFTAACGGVTNPEGWAPPVVEDETLYVSLDRGELSALNAESFEEIWTFGDEDEFACGAGGEETRDLEGIYGPPAIGDDLIYVGAYDGTLYALAKDDGLCEWLFETGDPIVGGPVLNGDRLFVPSTDGNLYVVNAETGQEVERFPAGEIWSTPLLAEDALYAGTMEGRVWKLAPDTLDDLWQGPFEVSAGLLAGPSGIGNSVEVVVAGGIGRTLYGIDAVSGEEAWSVEGDNWFWGQPTSDEARVYATNLSGHVIAVDLASGEEAWSFDTGAPIRAGAVITDDGLIAVNQEGDVYGLDSESGEVLWGPTSLDEVVHADPIVVQDEVLVVSRSGDVFLIDPETGVPTEVVR